MLKAEKLIIDVKIRDKMSVKGSVEQKNITISQRENCIVGIYI